MKPHLKILSVIPIVIPFVILPIRAPAQEIELRVIEDRAIWPVHSSDEPREEVWWLVSPDSENVGARRVTVIFHRPYCSKQKIEPCDTADYSQNFDMLTDDGASMQPPPFFLLRGRLDWQRSRRGRIPGKFRIEGLGGKN